MHAPQPWRMAGMQNFCNTAPVRIAVTITSRGVITLPARVRRALGLRADDQLIAEVTPEGLLLRPAVTIPVEIYSPEREREFDESEAELAAVLRPVARPGRQGGRARKRGPGRTR
jgi:AbrB family looped-hinge helix DNA binding protein